MPPSEYYRVAPVRVENGPQIDGRLDEEVWLQAAVVDEFVQQEPAEGEPATERTVVRLLYDAEALYLGVEAYDSEPDGVIATEMRRDSLRLLDEDNFQVILDTFHDRRSGYMFVTSPLGAKLEQQVAEEGEGGWRGRNSNNININWDGVWDVVSRRTADGWVAEIAIPMVTLRFPRTEQQVWGVNFMRNIRRKNEQVFWAPISKEYTLTRVSLAGTMTGIGAVNRGLDLRMTPYMLAGGRQDRAAGAVAGGGLDGSGFNDYGLDVKYGVASGLNLDLTLNTDFAQVEVDEQQVNLTRFPLFFPEKRDFFLENAGMFNVGTPGSGFGRVADLFFTRAHRPVGRRSSDPDHRRRAAYREGEPPQRRRDEHHDGVVRQRGRQLLRRALQPRHPRALEGRRDRDRQAGRRQRVSRPTPGESPTTTAPSRPTRRWPCTAT